MHLKAEECLHLRIKVSLGHDKWDSSGSSEELHEGIFYCLLSLKLPSLFLPSADGIKTCEIAGIYIGRFGSSFIFLLGLSDVNQRYGTLSKNVLECACV